MESRSLFGFDVIQGEGNASFHKILKAVKGDRHNFQKIRGILLVADSGHNVQEMFDLIKDQLKAAGGYPIPSRSSEIAPRTVDCPAVAVTFLPDDVTAGSLETLCNREIVAKQPWIEKCVTDFLNCGQISASTWSPEKQDKARYHCMVASLNEADPSRALSFAFKTSNPIIDLRNPCFDEIATRLRKFHMDFLS